LLAGRRITASEIFGPAGSDQFNGTWTRAHSSPFSASLQGFQLIESAAAGAAQTPAHVRARAITMTFGSHEDAKRES
jgi:hypothetical protein